jgi:hypothetical protein
MKKSFQLPLIAFFVFALLFASCATKKPVSKPIASPRDSVSRKIHGARITINYGSPSVRGRKIWGALVPYDSVWRAGANEATRFTTDKDILVEGKTLPAGTYGFFVIPKQGKWIIIFNSVANQWGAFKYDKSRDVLRVTVKPTATTNLQERLVYTVNPKGVVLTWENLNVPIMIE